MIQKTMLAVCAAFVMAGASGLSAQDNGPLKYVDAQNFRMINKGFTDTETPYTRIPKYLKDSVRPDLWNRAQCSSGLGIRFATDSKRVGIRYTLLWDTHMFHMADTGLKGTDLYILTDEGVWEYVNTNRPIANENKECEKVFVENLDGKMHEYIVSSIVRRCDKNGTGCRQCFRHSNAAGRQSAQVEENCVLRNKYSSGRLLNAYWYGGNQHDSA